MDGGMVVWWYNSGFGPEWMVVWWYGRTILDLGQNGWWYGGMVVFFLRYLLCLIRQTEQTVVIF